MKKGLLRGGWELTATMAQFRATIQSDAGNQGCDARWFLQSNESRVKPSMQGNGYAKSEVSCEGK